MSESRRAFCLSCGVAVSPSDARCHNCGSDLTKPDEEISPLPDAPKPKREANLASVKKEQLALLVVGVVALIGLSVLGYQASVSGKKGFALSGAAGAGAQPESQNSSVDSRAIQPAPPPPKVITDKATLERIEVLKAQYDKETDSRKKRLAALALSEIFIENERLDLGGEWSLAAFEATDRKELKLLLRAANLYDDAQQYAIASQLYARYLELDSANADARVDYAISLLNQGLQREGVTQMRRVVDECPNHQKANLNLGILYAQIERWEEARKLWQKARDLDPQSDAGKRAAELLSRYASQGR
ncbi:MAG: tetratricopeptide repeat protein [Chloroherpetonaceae bacterium]|nr:tetratricopeptide repeat protein [Chloroherpetonaceae bacterium]MDW8438158.1 tetratricopeptide repeat protein [Chloroherpetonaceae bacterium]